VRKFSATALKLCYENQKFVEQHAMRISIGLAYTASKYHF